jgi:hypothetical protein
MPDRAGGAEAREKTRGFRRAKGTRRASACGLTVSASVLEELIRTAHLAQRSLAWAVERAHLTPREFAVLSCLDDLGELSNSELARVMNGAAARSR